MLRSRHVDISTPLIVNSIFNQIYFQSDLTEIILIINNNKKKVFMNDTSGSDLNVSVTQIE